MTENQQENKREDYVNDEKVTLEASWFAIVRKTYKIVGCNYHSNGTAQILKSTLLPW